MCVSAREHFVVFDVIVAFHLMKAFFIIQILKSVLFFCWLIHLSVFARSKAKTNKH